MSNRIRVSKALIEVACCQFTFSDKTFDTQS